jgi:hypothetical protein
VRARFRGTSARELGRSWKALVLLFSAVAFADAASVRAAASEEHRRADATGCTPEERRDELRALQARVLATAPRDIDSLTEAIAPGGALAGWRLSHGLVVLEGAGAVAVDNLAAKEPMPPLLLYAPPPTTPLADLLDFDGDDGPYRLVGWAYLVPYRPGSAPPERRCIAPSEWFVHEAGSHLVNGGMALTPGATTEPAATPRGVATYFWHPQGWDIHFWVGDDGVPAVAFHNPNGRPGGVRLPEGAFFYLVDGRRQPPPEPPALTASDAPRRPPRAAGGPR